MTEESLARTLRVLRAEQDLTLTEAAEKAGVRYETISELERGVRRAQNRTLGKLARAYGVSVEELVGEAVPLSEAPETGRSSAEGHLTIHRNIEDLEDGLTPEQVREILVGVRDGRITVEAAAHQLARKAG